MTVKASDQNKHTIKKNIFLTFVNKKEEIAVLCRLPDFKIISEGGMFVKKLPPSIFPYMIDIPETL